MKMNIDKKYIYCGLTALFVALSAVLFNFLLNKYEGIFNFFGTLWKITSPIIYGCIMAFLFDPIVNWIEKRFLPFFNKKLLDQKNLPLFRKKIIRVGSIIVTYIIVLAFIAGFIIAVVPQITDSIEDIINSSNQYRINFLNWATGLSAKYPEIYKYVIEFYQEYSTMFEDFASSKLLPVLQSFIGNMYTSVFGVFSTLKNLIIGFVVSIYILLKKEVFKGQLKKISYGIFKIKTGNALIRNTRFVKEKFSGFIIGKIIDSIIIGLICYIGCLIFKFDYPILLAIIIGVSNIIPFFGPIIGAVPCALLLLLISPIKCLYFIIFIIVLQLLDGNVIGPKILGSSTGLDSFWVIFAITTFGGLWGIPGMIIGVPLFAVVYAAIKTLVETSLKKRELSVNTNDYIYVDHINEESKDFVVNTVSDDVFHTKTKKKNIFNKRIFLHKEDNLEERESESSKDKKDE